MRCKCSQYELGKRGRRWKQYVDQFHPGESASHQQHWCLHFKRGTNSVLSPEREWTFDTRPQLMTRIA